MKQFDYIVVDKLGLHARPAGLLVKEASKYKSNIIVEKGSGKADAKRLFALMSLGVKFEDSIKISFEGEDEESAYEGVLSYIKENL